MKNIKKKYLKVFAIVALFATISSCNDFLDVKNLNDISDQDVRTVTGIKYLETGVLDSYKGNYNYFWPLYISHAAGEYDFTTMVGEGPMHSQVWSLNMNSQNVFNGWLYAGLYTTANSASRIISILENNELIDPNKGTANGMSDAEKGRILGTAYFMRALSYFYLLVTWGRPFDGTDKWGVVLYPEVPKTRDDTQRARAKVSETWAFIESDLNKAKTNLSDYTDIALQSVEKGRPTKASALGLLGKVLVFQKKYPEAITVLDEFFTNYTEVGKGSKNYRGLMEYYGDLFHQAEYSQKNCFESLFELQYGDLTTTNPWEGGGTGNNYQMYIAGPNPLLGRGNVSLPDTIFGDFDKYDIRSYESRFQITGRKGFKTTPDTIIYHGVKIPYRDSLQDLSKTDIIKYKQIPDPNKLIENYPKKYINRNSNGTTNGLTHKSYKAKDVGFENQLILRVAEIYYLYAEAVTENGGDIEKAKMYVNRVVRRAHGYYENEACPYDFTGSDVAAFRKFWRADKRKEFIGEQVRWYDIVRWGTAAEECAMTNAGGAPRLYSDRAQCFPIPLRDVLSNLKMEQNPGY